MDCHWLAATDSLLTSAASLLTLYLLLPTLPTSTDLYWLSTGKKGGGPVNNLQKGLSAMLLNWIPGQPAAEVDGLMKLLYHAFWYLFCTRIIHEIHSQFHQQSIPSQARTVSYFPFNKQLSFLNKLLLKASVISSCRVPKEASAPCLNHPSFPVDTFNCDIII